MPKYDTCFYDDGFGNCTNEDSCSFRAQDMICTAKDEDLLTYEDYLQKKAIQTSSESETK